MDECERPLAIPIDVVVMDRRKSAHQLPHFDVVEAMLQVYGSEWKLAEEFQTPADSPQAVAIYTRPGGIAPTRSLPRWVVPPVRWIN